MNTNLKILELLNEIITDDIHQGYWQLEFLLNFIMNNPESINNLTTKVYPFVAQEFNCNPWCIEKNISRLIPLIDTKKLSQITGTNINVEALTTARLIKILIIYLKLNNYKSI
ncbi:MAG: hypothetical protein IKA10_07770 [Oscillospiraceae bacterium]|nr:hypothetical protein [Oscillospiraceae bacterium]